MSRKELMESKEVKFDVRLIERELREGKISRKDYEAYLNGLADDESRGTLIEIPREGDEEPAQAEEGLTFTHG